jgi:hypothetical protein
LSNSWFIDGLASWTEVNKKTADGTEVASILNLASASIVSGAPSGAQYAQGRNIYGTAVKIWFTQTIEDLPAGSYALSCVVAGWSATNIAASLVVIEADDSEQKQAISFPGGGWKDASDNTFTFTSPGGNVKFGIYIDAQSGNKIGGSGDPGMKFTNFQLTKIDD